VTGLSVAEPEPVGEGRVKFFCRHGFEVPANDCPKCKGVPQFSDNEARVTYFSKPVGEDAKPETEESTWQSPIYYGKTSATELQLLVVDMGDSCVVKVEKGEFEWTVAHTFNVDKSVMLSGHTFAKLKEAIDGVKPAPRIERDFAGYVMIYRGGRQTGATRMMEIDYDALSELAGKPLPIYEGGTWEDLLPRPEIGIGWELPIGVWRYKKNA